MRVLLRAMNRRHASVFVDMDNVSVACARRAMQRAKARFEVRRIAVYTDWRRGAPRGAAEMCDELGAEQIHVRNAAGKNSSDIRIAVDVMQSLLTTDVGQYVLVTNDADFRHLLLRIREHGARGIVHNCAPTCSTLLRAWSHECWRDHGCIFSPGKE